MTAKIIQLASSGTKACAHTDIRLPGSLGFMSTCPNCKDVRSLQIYGFRTLVSSLVDNQPIEAHCASAMSSGRSLRTSALTLPGCSLLTRTYLKFIS